MMDVESQAMPASQEAAPADAPRDGIARGTEGSPDENRPATVAGSPAAAPPPAKRARTAATEGVKSFDGAKQFIAQLREAERAPPAEPDAEPHARDPARETRFAETASPRTGTRVVAETGSRVKEPIETTAEANRIADADADGEKETRNPANGCSRETVDHLLAIEDDGARDDGAQDERDERDERDATSTRSRRTPSTCSPGCSRRPEPSAERRGRRVSPGRNAGAASAMDGGRPSLVVIPTRALVDRFRSMERTATKEGRTRRTRRTRRTPVLRPAAKPPTTGGCSSRT